LHSRQPEFTIQVKYLQNKALELECRSGSIARMKLEDPSMHPADYLAQLIEQRGQSKKQFAAELNISPAFLSMLLHKQRKFSSSIISQIAKVTNVAESQWEQRAKNYQLWNLNADKATETSSTGRVLSHQDILQHVLDGHVTIDPFWEDNLRPAYVDLTLGETKALKSDHGSADLYQRLSRESLILEPGSTWLAWTHELVQLPNNICGRLAAMGDLVLHGILVGFGVQIDPGWRGHPYVLLNNASSDPFEISAEQPFISLELRLLTSPANINPSPS
jgi:deoxycytidine triphosphate deaminase